MTSRPVSAVERVVDVVAIGVIVLIVWAVGLTVWELAREECLEHCVCEVRP